MNENDIALTVNRLRDIAKEYGQTQQLRERIAAVVVPLLSASKPAVAQEYVYETYTGQCGWLVVSKEEYENSEYRKRRAPLASSPTAQDDKTIIRELQKALFYWMPSIAGQDSPAGIKAAEHSYLLYGLDDNSTDCEGDRMMASIGIRNRALEQIEAVVQDLGCPENMDMAEFLMTLPAAPAQSGEAVEADVVPNEIAELLTEPCWNLSRRDVSDLLKRIGSILYTAPQPSQPVEAGEPVAASCESCDGEGLIGSHACPDCRPTKTSESVEPIAWMVISDWTCQPLLTTDKSVALGWKADKREVVQLCAIPQPAQSRDVLTDSTLDEVCRLATHCGLAEFRARSRILLTAPQPAQSEAVAREISGLDPLEWGGDGGPHERRLLSQRGVEKSAVVLDDERAAKAIPDGWCLVPAKATDAMVNAVRAGKLEPASPFHVQRAIETIKSNYLKMLAAVPAEPAEWPDAKACAVSPQATADTPAKLARDAVRMLEGYAESYESMAKMDSKSGDGTVQCRSVARDIRANMAGWFGPHLTEQATATQPAQTERALTDEQVAAIMTQAQVFASAYSLVGSRFDNGDGFEHSEAMKEELRTLLTAAQSASGAGHE